MVKIDRTELLRSFLTVEIIFVVIPAALFWSIAGILTFVAGSDFTALNACCIFLLFTLYLYPAGHIASAMFYGSSSGFFRESVAVWLVAICMYSIIAFLLALILSLYMPLEKRGRSSAEPGEASRDG